MGRARELANLFSGGSADINVKTSDGGILNLQTSDTTVTQDSVIGSIQFQAPDEASGTDSILVASKIEAVAEGTFSASFNATSLVFTTASSAAAGTAAGKMTFTSAGNLVIKDTDTADGSSPTITLQSGDTDIAQDDILGTIEFQAPDEGTGTDAILLAAAISAISEGDFSSSSNATKLSFKTGASEAAAEKMSLSSAGLLTVSGRIITDDTTEATSTTDGSLQTDGGLSVAKDIVAGDDVKLLSDSAVLSFGADSEIQLIHVADDGLILKHTGTGDGKEPSLTFQAGDNDIAQDDVLGSIFFQAPDEGAGTDAILVAAGIEAVSEGDFSSSSNATSLIFKTGASEAAAEKMRVTSGGQLLIGTTSSDFDDGADDLIVGNGSGDSGLTIFTGANVGDKGSIFFADATTGSNAEKKGQISYEQNNEIMTFFTNHTKAMEIDAAGHITKPLQPAFLVYPNSTQSNMANDEVLVFDLEVYDVNADFASNTFTAPVTGKYLMCVAARIDSADSSAGWIRIEMVTSNRSYSTSLVTPSGTYQSIDFSIIVDMDANDTCFLRWGQTGGSTTADKADATRWSGALIC